jgi:hypothetical protein
MELFVRRQNQDDGAWDVAEVTEKEARAAHFVGREQLRASFGCSSSTRSEEHGKYIFLTRTFNVFKNVRICNRITACWFALNPDRVGQNSVQINNPSGFP